MKHICKDLKWLYERSEKEIDALKNNLGISDLTNHQFYYLQVICQMNGSTLSEIAEKLKIKKPTVTTLISRLIKKGYVRKLVNKKDSRSSLVEVTGKAKRILTMRDEAFSSILNEFNSVLTANEVVMFSKLLKKLSSATPRNGDGKISNVMELRKTA